MPYHLYLLMDSATQDMMRYMFVIMDCSQQMIELFLAGLLKKSA